MVYLPQVVFKHILSFKDPRYERVMNGNPYMATPTRVFVVGWEEYERHGCGDAPWVDRMQYTDFVRERDYGNYEVVTQVGYSVYARNEVDRELYFGPMRHIRLREANTRPKPDSNDPDAAIKCSYKAIEMSMQCEACGPDLELYQRRR